MRRFGIGLSTDDKGQPALVVHPEIKLGRAHFRPVGVEQPEPEETPKQRARRELKKRMTDERLSKQRTGGPDPEKG
ncbi:hypothetical protein [Rhodococcus sp. JVH1]|uniref:hypothetical protein n=1 Tax=Rhodococcus sp. JVH1 TaxID=745408 RepID=UPI0005C1D820|nr:hypothetical protein [Rhodococcus sp. JVH1]